jgi:hypothetical protein
MTIRTIRVIIRHTPIVVVGVMSAKTINATVGIIESAHCDGVKGVTISVLHVAIVTPTAAGSGTSIHERRSSMEIIIRIRTRTEERGLCSCVQLFPIGRND